MHSEKITVSVVIPIYNVEKYLRECVDSVLSQTYKELEIILVDDGSPDSCGKICDRYAEKDSRVKVIHKKNGGVSEARNVGLDCAKGKYISFIDPDDWVEKDLLQETLDFSRKTGTDIVCFEVCEVRRDKKHVQYRFDGEQVFEAKDALEKILIDIIFHIHLERRSFQSICQLGHLAFFQKTVVIEAVQCVCFHDIGVGKNGLAPYPYPVGNTYQIVNLPVEIDEQVLTQIAQSTDGQYYRATNNDELKRVYSDIDKLEKSKLKVKEYSKKYEMFQFFGLGALVCLLLELLLRILLLRRIP